MGRHKRLIAFAVAAAIVYGLAIIASIVLIVTGVMDLSHWLQVAMVVYNAFFAAIFTHTVIAYLRSRTIFESLEMENKYSLGSESYFFNLYAFQQRVTAKRNSFRFAKKENYLMAFTASPSSFTDKSTASGDEINDLNLSVAEALKNLLIARAPRSEKHRHVFCFDHGIFLVFVFNHNSEYVNDLAVSIRDEIYSILEKKHYHIYVQPFFGIAKAPQDSALNECIDKVLAARKRAERTFESIAFYDERISGRKDNSEVKEVVQAYERGEFVVYYQPKFSLTKRQFVSSEALIRWESPIYGVLGPARFMDRIEAAGLLHELDFYVFQHVCEDLADSIRKGRRVIPVSINFSLYEFYSMDFLSKIMDTIHQYKIDPHLIEVEIVETTSQANQFLSISIIKKLRENGIRVLMDDFGIGYSNIGNLRKIPFDAVKIDKSFIDGIVEDEAARNIVATMIELCRATGHEAIAEGVDNRAEVEILRKIHCDTIQGFYYSQAIPKETYDKFLLDNPFEGRRHS